MTVGGTFEAILFAAIPVTVMLVIEVVLPYWKSRRLDETSLRDEFGQTRLDIASPDQDQTRRDVASMGLWRQDGHYYQILHQSAHAGNLVSMDKLGELALIRKDLVEAFYWKLLMKLHHGRSSGLPARGVCRVWLDAGCPGPNTGEGRLFMENQARLSMAVLNLWSGCHVQESTEIIRQMTEEGNEDALLYVSRFGIGESES